jgi:transposase
MLVDMKAYSLDLRQRMIAAIDRGMARTHAVTTFQVSLATLKRWLAKRRDMGDLTPRLPPGLTATITPAQEPILRAQLEAYPDATLAEHAERWNAAQGATLTQWTVGRAIRCIGWTRKKRP